MAKTAFVLLLSDDPEAGGRLRDAIRERFGHACSVAHTLDDARASIRGKSPDVVVAPARLNGSDVLGAVAELLDDAAPDATLVVLGDDDGMIRPRRVTLTRLPADTPLEDLVRPIGNAAHKAVARREDRALRESLDAAAAEDFEGIVGTSRKMRQIIERIGKAARNKLTVLILGETGVGKELIARAIHRRSDRASRPMKHLNCAGLNENLLESELFGHVRGAFTSAVADRKGYFEAAHGGTLFLDEIGDMPLTMQAKLLRALENREITPVGSTDVRRVDVRVVAATHRNLAELLEEGKFREDLYYRLHQWVIEVPPLRERREDVPLLVHRFVQQANAAHGTSVTGVSSEAMAQLTQYYWPGNVRELENTINTLVVEVEHGQIEADALPERIRGARMLVPASMGSIAGLTLSQVERMLIQHTLNLTGGNREQAAQMLGIGTRTLYRKIKEYGLS